MRLGVDPQLDLVDDRQPRSRWSPGGPALDAVGVTCVSSDPPCVVEAERSRTQAAAGCCPELEPRASTRARGHLIALVPPAWPLHSAARHAGTSMLNEEVIA